MSTVANAPIVIDNIRPAPLQPGQLPSARPQSRGNDDVSFWDFVDVINPLQHLPIISTIYREITGDTIKPMARVAGGALFGGPLGAGLAVVTEIAEEAAGLNNGETLLSLFDGDDEAAPATQVAEAPSAAERIGQYATAGAAEEPAPAPAGSTMPASAAPVAVADASAAPAAAPAAAAATTAGADARFFPMASPGTAPAGFMPIRAGDLRAADAMPRMPVPEKRPAGLAAKGHDLRAVAAAPTAARPASAALLTQTAEAPATDGAQYIRVPSKAEMVAASAEATPAAAPGSVSQQTADAAVLRALEAQGLQAEADRHPMLRAATAATAAPVAAPVTAPVRGATGYATAAESIAAAEAAETGAAGAQEVPGWFDQAMMKALDRYQQTGALNTARPASVGTGA